MIKIVDLTTYYQNGEKMLQVHLEDPVTGYKGLYHFIWTKPVSREEVIKYLKLEMGIETE